MTIEIREIQPGGDLQDFLEVVDLIYRDEPNYIRPLDMEVKNLLSKKSPFFQHGEAIILTAYRNNWCVGRCTAHINHTHLEKHRDETGFFGFLDTIDDQEVVDALIERASEWLRERKMKKIIGPFNLSINDEWGILVEGFDSPNAMMTPYHLPYQAGLLEKAGLAKVKDSFGWRYEVGNISKRVLKAEADIDAMPEITIRPLNMRKLDDEINTMLYLFNDAWSENWHFVPSNPAEAKKMAADLRLVVVPELTYLAYLEDRPVAVVVTLPNLNEATRDIGGKLFPLGFAKLIYRLKIAKLKSARLVMLGIAKELRHQRQYAGLSLALYAKMDRAGQKHGVEWGEISWTLEDNGPVNTAIKMMGGKKYKTWRAFGKDL